MIAALRRFPSLAWLSYRALFTWLNPAGYVSSLIVFPAAVGVLLVTSSQVNRGNALHAAVGSALLASVNATMFGTVLAVTNERQFGTLALWLSSPQSLLGGVLAKSLMHVLNGLVSGAVTLMVVSAAFGLDVPARAIPTLLLSWVSVAISAVGVGIMMTAWSIRSRDALTIPNILRSLILVASGAVVNVNALAVNLSWLRPILPVGHAAGAALAALDQHKLAWGLLAAEVAVGLAWGTAGYLWLRGALAAARRTARLELS